MSDYSQITTFTTKDGLSTGDPEKIIAGADFDAEFGAISTAIASKYDSTDIASQVQAEGESSNSVLMTPLRVANWADANQGLVGDLQALSGLGAGGDKILGFDDTTDTAIAFTIGNGLTTSGTTFRIGPTAAGNGLTESSGVLAVGAGSGITVNANDVQLANQSATTTNPVAVSGGTISLDLTALTAIESTAVSTGEDVFIIHEVGGNPKAIRFEDAGFRTRIAAGSQTLDDNDMMAIFECDGTRTITIPANATQDIANGVGAIFCNDNASTYITIQAATGVTLNSIFHPGGALAESDRVIPGGTAVLLHTEDNEWYLAGDIAD